MQLNQKHFAAGAIVLMFGLVEYYVWSGFFKSARDATAEIRGQIPQKRKLAMDAELAAETARKAWQARRTDWLRSNKAAPGSELGKLLEASRTRPEAIRERTQAVKESLQLAKSEAAIRLEIAGELDGLAKKNHLTTADRTLGRVVITPDAATGCREITADFAFRLNAAAMEAMLDRKLDEALPYMAVDTFVLAPVSDNEHDPAKKRFDLKGKLVGYFLPPPSATPAPGAGTSSK